MARYQSLWKVVEAAALVDVPDDAVGITVTPSLDGGPTFVVAWLQPAPSEPTGKENGSGEPVP